MPSPRCRPPLVLLLFGLLLTACSAGQLDVPTPTPELAPAPEVEQAAPAPEFSGDSALQLAWFYRPPADSDYQRIADAFDFFILTNKLEDGRQPLRSHGETAPFYQYLRAEAIQENPCDRQPYYNQVADRIGDFCEIEAENPDWFLRDSGGNYLYEDDYPAMDPANPDWQSFFIERALLSQKQLGWDGLFLDNIEASLGKRDQLGARPAKYSTDEVYTAAVASFLSRVYDEYKAATGLPVYANVVNYRNFDNVRFFTPWLDGIMLEAFATDWNNRHYSQADWEEQMAFVEEMQAAGKTMILVAQGQEWDQDRQRYALASYLLINNGNASFRYAHHSDYSTAWLYDNYSLALGLPEGPRSRTADGQWVRQFQHGYVVVNPTTQQADIILQTSQ